MYHKAPLRFLILAMMLTFVACVPQRKFQDLSEKERASSEENKSLTAANEALRIENNEALAKVEVSDRKLLALASDTAVLGTSLRILRKQYDKINNLNDELLSKTMSLREGTEADKKKLMGELEELKIALLAKEDALAQLEKSLNAKELEILAREAKLDEMRGMLSAKDSTMNALRNSIANALLGFEGKGLSVEYKNGRVYVSMDAKLLFATGSAEVDNKGKEVIIGLAKAVQDQDDLHIMVEGHTDTDAFNRNTFPRNNWDLSVLRATSVVNFMLDNSSLDPKLVTAAGRSQYVPVDSNDKSKNRRIEVILTPNLDDLLGIVNAVDGE
jgi:chemotaxis protein MotB